MGHSHAGGKTASQRIELEAARFGFTRQWGRGPEAQKAAWVINCSVCKMEFRAYWPAHVPTESMVKNMRMRHWDVGQGMRPLCPTCAHPTKDKSPAKKPEAQNFKPWEPPGKQFPVYHALLSAAERNARRAELKETLADAEADLIEAEAHLVLKQEECAAARRTRVQAAADARAKARVERVKRKAEEIANRPPPTPPRLWIVPPNLHAAAPMPTVIPTVENPVNKPNVAPKIMHAVFQQLDVVFDAQKRLYHSGWTDQRVAKECGTSDDVVTYLRYETFGELAEDPRIKSLRDDIALLGMQLDEVVKNSTSAIRDLTSRVDQMAKQNIGR